MTLAVTLFVYVMNMSSTRTRSLEVLVTRFLSGEASADEVKRLRPMLKDPAVSEWFTILRNRWEAADAKPTEKFDSRQAWRSISAELRHPPGATPLRRDR